MIIDIEANSLVNPSKIWCIVCKDIDTGELHIFRNLIEDEDERRKYLEFHRRITQWCGHNILGYDLKVITDLLGVHTPTAYPDVIDTLIVSKLVDYSRPLGHSLESYGTELGLLKIKFNDFTKYSKELEQYCIRDVEVNYRVYLKYLRVLKSSEWSSSLKLEHSFQTIVNNLSTNGFSFNSTKALKLLNKVKEELEILDKEILDAFRPKLKLVREVNPRPTKYNTISLSSIPQAIRTAEEGDLSAYTVGAPFSYCRWTEFNPSSHKQLIQVLTEAGWQPTDKTTTHIDLERHINRLKYSRGDRTAIDKELAECYIKLENLKKTGWKINETNLSTLPEDAPASARYLAKRILLESRRRTLTEWLDLVQEDNRIHGKFYGIGAWTHRMAHQNPNTANIPTGAKLYGDEMRSLWQAPRNRLLVGVDAEGIQLRIFAHYIDDPEFTESLVRGKKEDKSDPHSLNARILGRGDRQSAKRFIYALLLGAGIGKLAEILSCSRTEAEECLDRILLRYTGFAKLKSEVIPVDARRGYFVGLDGRRVRIPGETEGARKHLCMSGYLQNGEAVVMKKACLSWEDKLKDDKALLVNFVHDEWQTETPNNMEVAIRVAKLQADSLREVGEELKLKCPLAGSYWNDDLKDYTIGTNWKVTH